MIDEIKADLNISFMSALALALAEVAGFSR